MLLGKVRWQTVDLGGTLQEAAGALDQLEMLVGHAPIMHRSRALATDNVDASGATATTLDQR